MTFTELNPFPVTDPVAGFDTTAFDLDAYLRRIDHPRVEPSAAALRSLHSAHVRAIPFENIDVALGRHRGIELPAIVDKLVRRDRGGYCFEHGLLFAAALEELGFTVRRSFARVRPDHERGSYTHMLAVVPVDGTDHLVDVGFGAWVMHPTPLIDGAEVDQAGWRHRIRRDNGHWVFEKHTADGWEALHATLGLPARQVDYEVFHHYTSTHPRSPFTGQLVVMRLTDGVVRKFVGHRLITEHADGRVETAEITTDQLAGTLRALDVELTPAELSALQEFYESAEDTEAL
ncbi:N-hydroxyarylamine O-acetyltransferase [Saccharopolyspora kobensis]|uniref:N-hydroxyarylamine O-acetyltransferase n=1 Tax=Saccharopolyspora kobensis TaxID=146035 RepID=A0A1H5VE89_9PSEU|nr:arylamine N-acetyltransferase [Saccharopolyspora kobensis]SEF85682.1 N-hydroxyarylamine O-acetyltransferase [Saccharopolyspora kobensis]SFC61616.1 N-hydroxyarylamine O-acetyltransferase [Saccharopolyspora kobensis]